MAKYICPKCGEDIRKVGICCTEYGSSTHFLKYGKDGDYVDSELADGETGEYQVECGNCNAELDLELGEVWDTLPERIKTAKD